MNKDEQIKEALLSGLPVDVVRKKFQKDWYYVNNIRIENGIENRSERKARLAKELRGKNLSYRDIKKYGISHGTVAKYAKGFEAVRAIPLKEKTEKHIPSKKEYTKRSGFLSKDSFVMNAF